MSYQNIYQSNFRNFTLIPAVDNLDLELVTNVSDLYLATDELDYDEESVFSTNLIAEFDGNRLPFKFDFNSSGTTLCQQNQCSFGENVIVSENYWNPKNLNLTISGTTTELCDVGLTGIDNGLVTEMSGETIEIYSGIYTNSDKYDRYKYDKRFKLHPITGFTTPITRIFNDNSFNYDLTYEIENSSVGYYSKLSGGFFQGFYKLSGYDYEVFPERTNLGWTTEIILRYRWTGDTNLGLNARYPENKGIFFYMGARAENKFYHYATGHPIEDSGYTRVTSGLTCMDTCGCSSSANTASTCSAIYQISGESINDCFNDYSVNYSEDDPIYDSVSNAVGFRLSGNTGNPRLCVKTYKITGDCVTTATTVSGFCHTTGVTVSGQTYVTGITVNEFCSVKGIFDVCEDTSYVQKENWVQIDTVFRRNTWIDDCDLKDKGGINSIVSDVYTATTANNSESLIKPPITHKEIYDPAKVEVVDFNSQWLAESKFRLGTLKIYVNGNLFMVINNFEEVIPRLLNVEREKQIGVPYNISIGGGTQGLHDNLTFSGNCEMQLSGFTYQQDPECLPTNILNQTIYSGLTTNIILEQYFGGSLIGDISAFRMYTEPLNASQVKHNFRILKDRYFLLDPNCVDCVKIPPTPTPTPTNTITPTQTPTYTPTPTQTMTPTSTYGTSPTPTSTFDTTPTQTSTQTPTNTSTPTQTMTQTPTQTQTPSNIVNYAYLLIEPLILNGQFNTWMADGGSLFRGFSNGISPSVIQSTFESQMNRYLNYSGWSINPDLVRQSPIPRSGGGIDSFGNLIQPYLFKTIEIPAGTIIGGAWFTWIIASSKINNMKMNSIAVNSNGDPNSMTTVELNSTYYAMSFNYTGNTIPPDNYTIYTSFSSPSLRLDNNIYNIYFKGNSLI